jgi:DNA-binding CsgD family transcriptional regulator
MLVGEAFIRAVADGPASLALEGEAGIGKSTVWAEIADRVEAGGLIVLRSRPAAAERSLTLSALGDLLEHVPERALATLPSPQRRAIDAALLRTEPAEDALEQRLLGAAVRSVLLELSAATPVVIAIDDVQWLDPPSVSTLGYALRRVGDARIGLLTAHRHGLPARLDLPALPMVERRAVRIGPLSLGALHHVLKARLGHPPARSTLVRIHEASRGNPLFALEIARRLHEVGEPPADQPLPVPDDVRELVRQRIRRLPTATREVLLTVAAQREPTVTSVATALSREIATDLEIAEREEITRLDGGSITFGHPLFAAAIYSDATDAQRREIHGRLAGTVEGIEKRARHRALASAGPDGNVAAELEQAARAAAARGAPLAAADLLRLALQMTPEGEAAARDDRTISLGQSLQRAGDVSGAERVLEQAVAAASTRRNRAQARLALANLLFDLDAGPRCGRLAAEALADAEDDHELLVYAHAMLAAVEYSDRQLAASHAREAKRLLDAMVHPAPVVESLVLYVYVGAEVQDGRPLPMGLVERALAIERVAPAPTVSDRLSSSLGYWLIVTDDLPAGRRWMEATFKAAVDEGDEGSVPYALSHLPQLELAAGNWARAEDVATRQLAAAIDLGQESQRLDALFNLSFVYVHQGREVEARPLIAELLRDAEAAKDLWDLTKGLASLGALELSLGDAASAAQHLLRADEGRDALGDEAPRRHDADLVESLVAAGDIDRALRIAEIMDKRACRYGRHSRLALAARERAVIAAASGRLDDAIAALEEAMREHDLVPLPFDRARTELVLGQVRRRRRERTLAKEAFASALATFDRLGATVWAARARTELDRVGLRRGSGEALTEGERRVAELVASGKTNREVAAMLFMSPKTVEANLARVYRKLAIGSRAELGAFMARGAGGAADQ